MRASAIILIALFCGSVLGDEYHLSPRFRTVYIMSMTNSLDQHLASRLTSGRVLWVVLDPASADAVLTDNVDDTFWNWLARTYPAAGGSGNNYNGANRADNAQPLKHRGTIFLVDPRRRLILWSVYELPKNASPNELDHSAARVTNQLRTAFGKK